MLKALLRVCQLITLLGYVCLFLFPLWVLYCGFCFQLSSLQEVIQEKEALLQEQAHQHQAELLRTAAKADQEAEVQQVCLL